MRATTFLSLLAVAFSRQTLATPVPTTLNDRSSYTVTVSLWQNTDKSGRSQIFDTVCDGKCWNLEPDMNDIISRIDVYDHGVGRGHCHFFVYVSPNLIPDGNIVSSTTLVDINCTGGWMDVATDVTVKGPIYGSYNDQLSSFWCIADDA
ncbi:hypothetical protein TrVFT333_007892 [Trichoderma virens FT-333]|nr:hypothetical protein TrVFT333_007892 [Trichoderma virens FT-333]